MVKRYIIIALLSMCAFPAFAMRRAGSKARSFARGISPVSGRFAQKSPLPAFGRPTLSKLAKKDAIPDLGKAVGRRLRKDTSLEKRALPELGKNAVGWDSVLKPQNRLLDTKIFQKTTDHTAVIRADSLGSSKKAADLVPLTSRSSAMLAYKRGAVTSLDLPKTVVHDGMVHLKELLVHDYAQLRAHRLSVSPHIIQRLRDLLGKKECERMLNQSETIAKKIIESGQSSAALVLHADTQMSKIASADIQNILLRSERVIAMLQTCKSQTGHLKGDVMVPVSAFKASLESVIAKAVGHVDKKLLEQSAALEVMQPQLKEIPETVALKIAQDSVPQVQSAQAVESFVVQPARNIVATSVEKIPSNTAKKVSVRAPAQKIVVVEQPVAPQVRSYQMVPFRQPLPVRIQRSEPLRAQTARTKEVKEVERAPVERYKQTDEFRAAQERQAAHERFHASAKKDTAQPTVWSKVRSWFSKDSAKPSGVVPFVAAAGSMHTAARAVALPQDRKSDVRVEDIESPAEFPSRYEHEPMRGGFNRRALYTGPRHNTSDDDSDMYGDDEKLSHHKHARSVKHTKSKKQDSVKDHGAFGQILTQYKQLLLADTMTLEGKRMVAALQKNQGPLMNACKKGLPLNSAWAQDSTIVRSWIKIMNAQRERAFHSAAIKAEYQKSCQSLAAFVAFAAEQKSITAK